MKIRFKIFLFLFCISPLFWYYLINSPQKIISEYYQAPTYLKEKITTTFDSIQYIDEFRWNDVAKDNRPLIGKFFYNKIRIIFDQIIIYLNLLNPSLYFQAGNIEIIPCLLFPVSIAAIFRILKNKKQKILLIGLLSCILAFITGHQSIYFTFPIALFYLYLASYELAFWSKKTLFGSLILLLIYSSFLFLRATLII